MKIYNNKKNIRRFNDNIFTIEILFDIFHQNDIKNKNVLHVFKRRK
jgi:hypothetical protein